MSEALALFDGSGDLLKGFIVPGTDILKVKGENMSFVGVSCVELQSCNYPISWPPRSFLHYNNHVILWAFVHNMPPSRDLQVRYLDALGIGRDFPKPRASAALLLLALPRQSHESSG